MFDPDDHPVAKGTLCAQEHGFNLHASTKVAVPRDFGTDSPTPPTPRASRSPVANDKPGRVTLCRYILRPPLANDRLHILPDGAVRLDFKKPWSDGTTSVELAPLALIARLAALVPPPKRHLVRYFGVLSSHSSLGDQVVPPPPRRRHRRPSRTGPRRHRGISGGLSVCEGWSGSRFSARSARPRSV